jgi:tRNA pseudouridine32 synthase/23S rRNA pseudouridine746 synthase
MASTALTLIHDDAHLIAIDKPAGLLSVPGKGPDKADCAIARVLCQFPDALVVHRLDMATSGLLLFARGLAAQQALSRAFETRQVHKTYIAEVHGQLAEDCGVVDLPLASDWPNRPRQKVDLAGGKAAVTHWQVLSRGPEHTRVALMPVTGRSHQLRVHMLSLGHPIVGDALYAPVDACTQTDRLRLHAWRLSLPHPSDGQMMSLEAPLPF